MIHAALAIAAIVFGFLGTMVAGALSAERHVFTDPAVLVFVALMGAGVFGLAYLLW